MRPSRPALLSAAALLIAACASDEEMGIGVEPGETKELTVTFPEADSIVAGCHVAGHYAAGMKATARIAS